jgi:uncharacterized protein (DUF111 family)
MLLILTYRRSLESLEIRVDAVELKISQLNSKVAESCANFEDVMAYVDANMADSKYPKSTQVSHFLIYFD